MKSLIAIVIVLSMAACTWAMPSPQCNGSSWDANTETDLAGYYVYWKTDPVAPYQDIDRVDNGLSTSVVIDDSLPAVSGPIRSIIHYFVVTAYDTSGNESLFSKEINCKRPPAEPQNHRKN